MKTLFCQTENVKRFLAGVASVEQRAAPEACLMLVSGNAGMGKTRCGHWFAVQKNAVHVRIKSAATPHWVLADVMDQLGESPLRSCEAMFGRIVTDLIRNPRPMVFDEVEHGLSNIKVLETVRDIGDTCEVPIILIGREFVPGALKRHRQISTRITAYAGFNQASIEDVRLLCDRLPEIEIGAGVPEVILKQSEGYIRNVITAIRNAEGIGLRRNLKRVTEAELPEKPLCQDWFKAIAPKVTAK